MMLTTGIYNEPNGAMKLQAEGMPLIAKFSRTFALSTYFYLSAESDGGPLLSWTDGRNTGSVQLGFDSTVGERVVLFMVNGESTAFLFGRTLSPYRYDLNGYCLRTGINRIGSVSL